MNSQLNIADTQTKVLELNKLASTIIQDTLQSNRIQHFIEALSAKDLAQHEDLYIETIIRCVGKIFNYFIDSRELVLSRNTDPENASINAYKLHIIRWYDKVLDLLCKIVHNQTTESAFSLNIQRIALQTLIRFVEEEGKFPFRSVSNDNELSFPTYLLAKIVNALVSETNYNQELIATYANYYEYDDWIHFTLQTLLSLVESYKNSHSAFVMQNIIDLLFPIRLIMPVDLLPKCLQPEVKIAKKRKRRRGGPTGDHKTWMRLCELQSYSDPKNPNPVKLPSAKFKFDYERDAGLYSSLWLKYLQFELPPATYKRALVYLDKYAIQHFANPLLLADFLMDSFKTGGIISLLSLSPLYTLMHKCNLDYPNFFSHLYQLLQPAVTYVHYRARFLFWCDLFLTSTHISSKIVASFAKKLARLALTATPDTILILLTFIGNLLIRHPTIQVMLTAAQFTPENDPFVDSETEPEKPNALNSYLWEVKALQSHYLSEVAQLATQITNKDLPSYEWNLADVLETDLNEVIQKATKTWTSSEKFHVDISNDLFNYI